MATRKTFSTWWFATELMLLVLNIILLISRAQAQTTSPGKLHPDSPSTIPGINNQQSIFIYPDYQNLTFRSPDTINATFAFPIRKPLVYARCLKVLPEPGEGEDSIFAGGANGVDEFFRWVLVPIQLPESPSCRLEFNPVYSGGLNITPYVPKSFEFRIEKYAGQGVTRGLLLSYTPTAALLGTHSTTLVPKTSSSSNRNGTPSTSSQAPFSSATLVSGPTPATSSVSSARASEQTPSISVGVIAGISAAGGALAIGVMMLGVLVWRRRRQNGGKEGSGDKGRDEAGSAKLSLSQDSLSVVSMHDHELETRNLPSEMWDPREHVQHELLVVEKPGELPGTHRTRQQVIYYELPP